MSQAFMLISAQWRNKMKRYLIIALFMLLFLSLTAKEIGKIAFFAGDVQYKTGKNAAFQKATLNMPVSMDGYVKVGLAAEADIVFNNNSRYSIKQNQNLSIREIYEMASQKGGVSKLKQQYSKLSLTNAREAGTTAGIRRYEVGLGDEDGFFWGDDEAPSLMQAQLFFENEEFEDAIPLLEEVIDYDPLSADAELGHVILIMIYDEQGNDELRDEHIDFLREYFPQSQYLELIDDV